MSTRARHFVFVLVLLLPFLACPPTRADTFYVQAGVGNDANPGDAWGAGHALATVTAALARAVAASGTNTINVAAGTYNEHVTMGNDVTLLGGYPAAGDGRRDAEANPTILDAGETATVVEMQSADNSTLDGFVITNGSRATGCGGGILVANGTAMTISGNTIRGNTTTGTSSGGGGGICLDSATQATVRGNTIATNLSAFDGGGIFLYYATQCTIAGNVIQGNTATNWGGGVNVYHSSVVMQNNVLLGNVAVGHGGGISLYDTSELAATNDTLTGNLAMNGTGGGAFAEAATAAFKNAIFWDNTPGQLVQSSGGVLTATYSDVQDGAAGVGNIALNPQFAFDDTGLPLLPGNSPCIDAATATGAPDADIRGIHRPWGRAHDMGAYEMVLDQPGLPLLLLQ